MAKLMSREGYVRLSLVVLIILGVVGAAAYVLFNGSRQTASASPSASVAAGGEEHGEPQQLAIPVKSVKPHFDKNFTMTVRRPADVAAYYRADLESRVPGVVGMIRTDKGDVVKKDEALIKLDVPDLDAKVEQAKADLDLSRAQVHQKEAAVESAKTELDVIEAKINAAVAKRNSDKAYLVFREKQAQRFRGLLESRSVDARLVDEQEDRREAAFEAVNAAEEAVKSARAQKVAVAAKVKQAEADLEEARANVKVKQGELDYAKDMLGFGTILAPFDGVIVRREVDPGSFVRTAAGGHSAPLLTIQRSDIITVVMRVPDNYAPFITPKTEAIFETPALPGVKIHGKVTRFPPSLVNPEHDRTMLVEVDLWNGSEEDYAKSMSSDEFKSHLKKGMPGDPRNGLPILPEIKGKLAGGAVKGKSEGGRQLRLLPGMFGDMTLVLRNFEGTYLLPSSAIVSEGGRPYIYVVRDGKATLQPVEVQVDDGKLVKVERLDKEGTPLGDLAGDEEVIVTNQGELSEGQAVKPSLVEDWRSLGSKNAKK
jgi:multidrug resistance efflux pump